MIEVVGLGPGHEDYILPIAIKKIQDADLVIGARRNLDTIASWTKTTLVYDGNLDEIANILKDRFGEKIVVAVSGDAAFYSLLNFVKRHVPAEGVASVPGISSLQYLYNRLGLSYANSYWISCHGRSGDIGQHIGRYKTIGILTDRKMTPAVIARQLIEDGISNLKCHIGEHLSYDDEKVSTLSLNETSQYSADPLCVVILEHEMEV